MKLTIFGLAAVGSADIAVAGMRGHLDWVSTPNGKAALVWLLFAVLVTVLACLGMRTHIRDRDAREAQEWADLDEWEAAMDLDPYPVRLISRAELDGEEERLATTHVPTPTPAPYTSPSPLPRPTSHSGTTAASDSNVAAQGWGQRVTPLLLDLAPSYVRDAPLVRWDPARRYDESYTGSAATFASDMRDGVPVYPVEDHAAKVFAGLRRVGTHRRAAMVAMSQAFGHIVDAPVSPAPGPYHRARHDGSQRHVERDYDLVALRALNEATGAFQLVGAR